MSSILIFAGQQLLNLTHLDAEGIGQEQGFSASEIHPTIGYDPVSVLYIENTFLRTECQNFTPRSSAATRSPTRARTCNPPASVRRRLGFSAHLRET